MTEAEIKIGLSAINAAISSGELSVSYAGRTTTYRSMDQLIMAKRELEKERETQANGGTKVSRVLNVVANI